MSKKTHGLSLTPFEKVLNRFPISKLVFWRRTWRLSHTVQPNFLARCRIQFAQEREPWFRDAFIQMRRQAVLLSCRSGDSSGPQRASDALAAKLSQLGSSSRGRRYLRALAGLFPE